MSLIKCPECGEEISSTAGKCIHCGYRFIVCPECGELYAEGVQMCKKCGYQFAPQATALNQSESAQNDSKELLNRITADNTLQNRMSIAGNILSLASLLLLGIVAILFFTWKNSDPLDVLFKYESTRQWCQILIILGAFVEVIFYGVRFCQALIISRCAKWIRQNKINFRDYLFSIRDANDRKTRSVYIRMKAAACYSEDTSARNLFIVFNILSALTFICLSAYCVILLNLCVEKAMMSYLTAQSFLDLFSKTDLIPVIVCFIIVFLFLLINIVIMIIHKQREKQWAQNNNL